MTNELLSDAAIPLHVWIVEVHSIVNKKTIYNVSSIALLQMNKMMISVAPILINFSFEVDLIEPSIYIATI